MCNFVTKLSQNYHDYEKALKSKNKKEAFPHSHGPRGNAYPSNANSYMHSNAGALEEVTPSLRGTKQSTDPPLDCRASLAMT